MSMNQNYAQPSYSDLKKAFCGDMSELRRLYRKYQQQSGDDTPIPEDDFSLFIEWALHIHEHYEVDLHSWKLKTDESFDNKTCYKASSRDRFFKSYFPSVLRISKTLRFTNKFLKKLGDVRSEDLQMDILSIMVFGKGGSKTESLKVNGLSYMSFSRKVIANEEREECSLIICSHLERHPVFDGENKVKAFKYVQVTRFLQILNENEKKSPISLCLAFVEDCKNDPARQELQPQFELDPRTKRKTDKFKIDYLTPEEIADLIYVEDLHRWVSKKEHAIFERRKENAITSKINAEVLEKFADFESSGKLVNLLEKMQSLKLKLTPEERRLIGQNGNVLAIGRSGTGKTTCCVLRLFSQEMLFKIRLAQAQVKHGLLRDARYMTDQMDNLIGIHSIFITASPVLTNEVRRYYENLSKKIKDEMKKKENSTSDSPEKKNKDQQVLQAEENKNEEDEEEDYLMDEEEVEAQAKFSKHYALDGIPDEEFPLFLTVKRVILMVDGTLQKPFFARKKDNSIIGSDTQAQWHNESKGLMMISDKYRGKNEELDENLAESPIKIQDKKDVIDEEEEDEESDNEDTRFKINENDLEAEYERYLALLHKKQEKQRLELEMKKKNNMNFEVDYEYFYNHFWMRHLSPQERPSKVTPALVWSEIMSSIKGSPESHLHPEYYLPDEVYTSLPVEDSALLNKENRITIHKYFKYYEEWKKKEGGYDFMDVVNHILNEIRLRGYNGVPIHFIMIDEVQDLSHATILLLMKITEQSVFFAGDTAQTIAKGVGVRFSDLGSLFRLTPEKEYLWKKPTVHQLTVNFRSHSKILDMANSVVTLIETFFPKTIDKLKKEKSEIDGPKPILLEDVDLEVLFAMLFGSENFKSHRHSQNQGGALEKPPIEFGCNQAIIVRDQESKNKLPPMLKHALCLTVYEAKGLEFDDVILYNFFSESSVSEMEWGLLRYLDIESKEVDKDTFERYYFTYKEEDLSDLSSESASNAKDDEVKDKEDVDLQAPNLFNTRLDESKNTYTLQKVTLPKKSYALGFEQYSGLCNEFKQLYVALTRPRNRIIIFDDNIEKRKVIEKYWKQLSLVQIVNKTILQTEKVDNNVADKDLESFKSLLVSTSKAEWKKQGLKMFRNKYYEQAAKCFEKAEEEKLHRRALAYMTAERASSNMNKIKSEQATLVSDLKKVKGVEAKEKNASLKKLKVEERTCYEDYERAALIFSELDLLKQASQCFFSAGKYERALEIYEKLSLLKEAGEACVMLKQFEKAAEMFAQGGDLVRAIDCYEMIQDYEKILILLQSMTNLPSEQRKVYGKKYVPLALQKLTKKVQFQSPEKPENNDQEILDVEDSFSEDEEKETIQLTKGHPEEEIKIESEGRSQQKNSVNDMSFDIIDKSVKEEGQKEVSDMSFENIEDSITNFEHLSQFDFKDEFLRSDDSVSVIESIKSHRKDKSFAGSEYSAIHQNYLINARYNLVQTQEDIFIQDSIMQKILKYIGIFSDEMKKNLEILCSKGSISNLHEVLDLDNLSLEVIHFILDFLEQNRLHKLCVFVCNRYNLPEQLGRYLVNMAFKYSNLPSEDIRALASKLFTTRVRHIQQEKAFVANTAVHNMLKIINPSFLRLKKKGEQVDATNSLGESCFRSLISLGMWKKCLFMMDYTNSLALASTFAGFENYKLIFLTGSDAYDVSHENIQVLVEEKGFDFLPFKIPQNKEEVNAAIIGLESVIWELSEKFPMYLYKQYKPAVKKTNQIKVPEFPSYFSYNAALWNFIINKGKDKLGQCIEKVTEDLEYLLRNNNGLSAVDQLKLFDAVSFLMQLSLLHTHNQPIRDLIHNMATNEVAKLIIAFRKIAEFTRPHSLNSHEEIILKAILSPLRIRFIERSSVLLGLNLHNFIVHISSPIVGELVSTGNTTNAILTYDIEANFLLAPIGACLAEIKKKMASVMKEMTMFQAKSQLTEDPCLMVEGIREDLKTRVDILGMISCCGLLQGAEIKSKKQKKIQNKATGKAKAPVHKEQLYSEAEGEHVRKGSANSFVSLESIKSKIIKDMKSVLSKHAIFGLSVNYYSRSELLALGLQKLKKHLEKEKLKTWVVHLFYLIDSHVILNEFLRNHVDNETAQVIQSYSDAIYYRKYHNADEYIHNTLDYLSGSFNYVPLDETVTLLETLTAYTLIAGNLGKNASAQVTLSTSLLATLQIVPCAGSEQTWRADIVPLEDQKVLGQIFHWISKVALQLSKEDLSDEITMRVLSLLVNTFANIPKLDSGVSKDIVEAVEILISSESFQFYQPSKEARKKNSQGVADKIKDEVLQNVLNHFNKLSLCSKEELEGLPDFYQSQRFEPVKVISNPQEAKENARRCESVYLRDLAVIAKRITLQRKATKFLRARKATKPKNKTLKPLYTLGSSYLSQLDFHSVQNSLFALNVKQEVFETIDKKLAYIFGYYGRNNIQEPIDFHHLCELVQKFVDCELEYLDLLKDGLIDGENIKIVDLKETHNQKAIRVETLSQDFERWCATRQNKENDEENLLKKKKLVRANWEEQALIAKMQEIARKRKALKKQELKERKAEYLKKY